MADLRYDPIVTDSKRFPKGDLEGRCLELHNILGLLVRSVEYHFEHTPDNGGRDGIRTRLAQAHDSLGE